MIKSQQVNIDTLTEPETENSPLMIAACLGINQLVAIYLNFTNSNVNACQNLNYTAMMLAAQHKHTDIIEMLLSIPDINIEQKSVPMKDYEGKQFNAMDLYLFECRTNAQPVNKKIMYLLQKSINIYKKVKQYSKESRDPLLIKAIEAKDVEMIKAIIASPRNIFDINLQKSSAGDTPLMIAMHNARNDAPWKINIKHVIDDEGNTALSLAESTMNTDIIDAINTAIQAKAQQDEDFEDEVLDEFDISPESIHKLTEDNLDPKETECNNSTFVVLEDHSIELDSKEETHTGNIFSSSSSSKDVMLPLKKRYFQDLLLASNKQSVLVNPVDPMETKYNTNLVESKDRCITTSREKKNVWKQYMLLLIALIMKLKYYHQTKNKKAR